VRYFPFLGLVDGQRSFLCLRRLLEPEAVAALHKQDAAQLLCDGILGADSLHFRAISAASREVVAEFDLPFDPREPLQVLPRLEFDLTGLLGWTGRPHSPCSLTGEALAWFLVAKDVLLRREANLPDPSADPLRALRRCLELASGDASAHELALDFAARLLRRGERRDELASLLRMLAGHVHGPAPALERLSALACEAGDPVAGADAIARAARLAPERADLVERAASQLFKLDRHDEVCEIVGLARERGVASASALAQLAAVHDRRGDFARRGELVAELMSMSGLPAPVLRLLASFLLEEERGAEAKVVVEQALALEPGHAVLRFELGRACLLVDDPTSAAVAFGQALSIGLSGEVARQARRLHRLAAVPGLWSGTRAVEQALARADLPRALDAARVLLHGVGSVAEAWHLYGVVRHRLGHERQAERALRRALRCDEQCADAHNRLGILLAGRGDVDEGHRHLVRAHELAPSDPATLLHLAQTCAMLGRTGDALQHVTAAESLGADPKLVAAVRSAVGSDGR
jgi:tetratricopeptide (TPR) repeat protein